MIPPIFSLVSSSAEVTDLIGTNPTRFYPFGRAPQNVEVPYAVWQIISGEPENFLSTPADMDRLSLQVDVFGRSAAEASGIVAALRNALEDSAYVTALRGQELEDDTGLFRFSFDVDWHLAR